MAGAAPPLVFNRDFDPQTGTAVAIGPGLVRVTAPNRSDYTFTGTNTYLVGTDRPVIVDPGPDDPRHLGALRQAIGGRAVQAVVLTHTHKDHSGLARQMAMEFGAPLWFGGQHRLSRPARPFEINPVARGADWAVRPDRTLADGERFSAGELNLEVIATPGHCANHLCIGVIGTPFLLSGDHVMGWNSTLVPVPDGSMSDYLRSLWRLIGAPYSVYLPGHGPSVPDGPAYGQALLAHREHRNSQVLEQVQQGPRQVGDLVRAIYPDLGPKLRAAAAMTLKAHVEYLESIGAVHVRRGLLRTTVVAA